MTFSQRLALGLCAAGVTGALLIPVVAALANRYTQRQLSTTVSAEGLRLLDARIGAPVDGNAGCVISILATAAPVPTAPPPPPPPLRDSAPRYSRRWCVRDGTLSWWDGERCVPLQRAGAVYQTAGEHSDVDVGLGAAQYQELVAWSPSSGKDALLIEQIVPVPAGWRRLDPRCWD